MKRVQLALVLALAAAFLPGAASAHPLGNFTVNRATLVTATPERIEVRVIVDLAEVPAYAAIVAMDLDASGVPSADERGRYASAACETARRETEVSVDGAAVSLVAHGTSELTFPPGVGGLETLRLVCPLVAATDARGGSRLVVRDLADRGRIGWHEIAITARGGLGVMAASVPAVSPSDELRAYPVDGAAAPLDVREGTATLGTGPAAVPVTGAPAPAGPRTDPLAALLADADDAPLLAAALGLALLLGAGHALSPGHGKTIVAAYLIGSRASVRQAAWLGLTVAASHTVGVLVIGVTVLAVGQALAPERLLAWLGVVSGALIVALGASLLLRASRHGRSRGHDHPHPHPHDHDHEDHHHAAPSASWRAMLGLGLAGGLVPSASAIIVLLAAVSTGRLAAGLLLIGAFGLGMALVLGGLAVATAAIRRSRGARTVASGRAGRLVAGILPAGSALVVLGAGLFITVDAALRIGLVVL